MPTTLTGLLLFVVLLLPGFTYVSIRERNAPERRRSPFQETAKVAAVSTVTNSMSAGAYTLLHLVWPATPSLGDFISRGSEYWAERYGSIILAGFGMLTLSVGMAAYGAAAIRNRSPHPSAVSSWWILFDEMPREMSTTGQRTGILTTAACHLSDGRVVEGAVFDYNTITDETPDRDLILVEPIKEYLNGQVRLLDCKALSVSARDIAQLRVRYKHRGPPERPSLLARVRRWLGRLRRRR